jgi:hypothetical protein
LFSTVLMLAALVPGATNNRILVLGPKASTASAEVRAAAVSALAVALEADKLTTRRMDSGNLIDIRGKRLLRDLIPIRLRSLIKAGCEGAVCARELRKAFSALGAVARVTIDPLGKGGVVTVWLAGINSSGKYAKRISRSVVVTDLASPGLAEAIAGAAKDLRKYKARPNPTYPTAVVPAGGAPAQAAPTAAVTDLAPWSVIADRRRKALQAKLEAQRKAAGERTAKVESEKAAELAKLKAEQEAAAEAAIAEQKGKAEARKQAEALRLDGWRKAAVGGEVTLRTGQSMVQVDAGNGSATTEYMGGAMALAAMLRVPLRGVPGLRIGIGAEGGTLPLHTVLNPDTQEAEAWVKLDHADLGNDEANEDFWYKYQYVYYGQLNGRVDLQFGQAPVGIFAEGSVGLQVNHGQVHHFIYDLDEQGNKINNTGRLRRDPSDEFSWGGLQTGFGAGLWVEAPKWPVTIALGYRFLSGNMEQLSTMERIFNTQMERELLALDVGYRF